MCRTYGARGWFEATQPSRAGLTCAAPTALSEGRHCGAISYLTATPATLGFFRKTWAFFGYETEREVFDCQVTLISLIWLRSVDAPG